MVNRFGAPHTVQKLNCVKGFLDSWAIAMSKQGQFTKRYIDAFSGSGHFEFASSGEPDSAQASLLEEAEISREFIDGSALLALDVDPPFSRIDLIEKDRSIASELRATVDEAGAKNIVIHVEDANIALPKICGEFNPMDRSVVFLDPFGAQLSWKTVSSIAATEAADVWYLLPVSIINRMMARDPKKIPDGWRARISDCFGTTDWSDRFYAVEEKTDLFGEISETSKTGGLIAVEEFFIERLRNLFPRVAGNTVRLLSPNKKNHIFSLCFAVANPKGNAPDIALRIANSVIKKWEHPNG